jgi:hypothetical protein
MLGGWDTSRIVCRWVILQDKSNYGVKHFVYTTLLHSAYSLTAVSLYLLYLHIEQGLEPERERQAVT